MMSLKLLLIIAVVLASTTEKVRYDNFTLYKITPKTSEQLSILKEFTQNEKYDFWTELLAIDFFVNVMVGPEEKATFEAVLKNNDFSYSISMDDVQRAIDSQQVKKYTKSNVRSLTWDAYYEFEDIYQWMYDIAEMYPDIITPLIGGVSVEGRNIEGIKISYGNAANKRAIFIEGGIHAREWISPATVTYITNEILTSTDNETRQYAEEFDWYIFPVTNPDGYIYTFGGARLWRKNRKHNADGVYGVDLNRNWDSYWMVTGASNITASEIYAGTHIFSEPESRSLANFITSVADTLDMYLSFHSFSQLLLIPYGHTSDYLDNYNDTKLIGDRAMEALAQRYETQYIVGNVAETIYEAAGSSTDWVKLRLQVPIVYCYELRDRGQFGFLLPAEQIIPNNLETMDSLIAMIREAKNLGYMNGWNTVATGNALVTQTSVLLLLIATFVCIFV